MSKNSIDEECEGCLYLREDGKCRMGVNNSRGYFALWDIAYIGGGYSLAPYVATPCRVVREMLRIAEIKPGETLYDLGCGDGRIVMLATGELKAKAVGYELEGELVKKARDKISELHLDDAAIVQDDLFKADIAKADAVTMYLTPRGNEEVKPKLEKELKPGARVVSLEFEMPGWKLDKLGKIVDSGLEYTIYRYRR